MRYFLVLGSQLGDQRPLDLLRSGEIETVLLTLKTMALENTW